MNILNIEHGDREERASCNHSRRQRLGRGRGRGHKARTPNSREEVSSTEGGAASAVEGATRSSKRCASSTTRGRPAGCCGCGCGSASGSAACERAGLIGGGCGCGSCWPPAVLLLLLLLLLLAGPLGAVASAEPEPELERGAPEADEETPAAASCGGGGEAASALLVAFESSAARAHGKAVQCTGHRQCASCREALRFHLHLRTRSPASLRERAASSACAPCLSCSKSGPDLWRARRSRTSVPVVLSTSTARLLS